MRIIKPTASCGVSFDYTYSLGRKACSAGLTKAIGSSIYAQDLAVETIFFATTYGSSGGSYFLVIDANTGDLLKDRIIISGTNRHVFSMTRYSDDLTNDR